jgi:riboflavin transporter FmnP
MSFQKTLLAIGMLTVLGYLGSMASLPVAFSVSFLFGSIFVIIAVSLFGPLLGGLSALIASSYTYILWNQVEVYVREHTEAQFSHSICPECMTKLYPEYTQDHK